MTILCLIMNLYFRFQLFLTNINVSFIVFRCILYYNPKIPMIDEMCMYWNSWHNRYWLHFTWVIVVLIWYLLPKAFFRGMGEQVIFHSDMDTAIFIPRHETIFRFGFSLRKEKFLVKVEMWMKWDGLQRDMMMERRMKGYGMKCSNMSDLSSLEPSTMDNIAMCTHC